MFLRFICPLCHTHLDSLALEEADCAGVPCRICPECDGLIPLPAGSPEALETLSATSEAFSLPLPSREPCPATFPATL